MRRAAMVLAMVAMPCACGSDDDDCAFGCPSGGDVTGTGAATAGSASATASGGSDASASASGSSTAAPTTTVTTADSTASTGESGGTTLPADTGTDAGADSGSGSDGAGCPPDGCAPGECFGIGVWASCAQYCTANDASCVEAGCDGATVLYYDDGAACADGMASGSAASACDAPLMRGGGVSFARCCCG